MPRLSIIAASLLLPLAGAILLALALSSSAGAQGPCGTPHDAMDSEEFAFLAELQAWRDSNLQYPSAQLVPSGPLNAAAAWQAEYLANDPFISNGHIDGEGRNWAERAEDCGYDSFWAYGSGEGVYALAGAGVEDVPLGDFVEGVLYPGSGATADFPSGPGSPPFQCVGVAKFHQQDPPAIAWIVILAQYPSSDCPEAQTSPTSNTQTPPTTTTSPLCGTAHDPMDSEEFAFLADLQDWRDANIDNSSPLTPSGPLNAAAAWFAEYVAAGGNTGPTGHFDNYGRDYLDRALDCGWPIVDSMGEGGLFADSAAQAAHAMPHKEFEVPDDPRYYPLHCIGVGRATVGNDTVWIMVIAAYPGECPQAQYTPQASTSATPSPTPTQTPVPTPDTWRSWLPGVTTE